MNGTNLKVEPHKSSLGMDANLLAMLAYLVTGVLAWIPGVIYFIWLAPLIVFFFEKNSQFVRFHCMQSVLLFAVNTVLALLVRVVIGGIVTCGCI